MTAEPVETTFAVVGGGFRAEAFLRVAAALPGRFRVSEAVVRNAERAAELRESWDVQTVPDLSGVTDASQVDFVVVAVRPTEAVDVITELTASGHAVLTETPAAPDIAGLESLVALVRAGARIQVAEQYHLEPLLSSQLALVRGGLIGDVSEAFVSVAHDYHGISVLRRMLGVGFENAEITARRFTERLREGPSRYSDPDEDRLVEGTRTTAWLDFEGGGHGTYDFDDQQYRSWIRSPSLLVRGSDGELRDETVRHLDDFRTPVTDSLERIDAGGAGNHEGLFLRGYAFGRARIYSNQFAPARLADDELSIATLLSRTGEWARGGAEVYSVAEAAQDQYLQLAVRRAAESAQPVTTRTQMWASVG
ncbi:Gfo/Idh/MocA family protein [Humibacter sp. RRB41]|uniref:Gfo/Idh/MocA family protein n=1 Tax=Humibacter sp. RRB41 TaxID=2919946 RepID=UPI001FAA5E7E|nr:Gfo/Idh/MocA family oxidoreductase [Humibacter sp. RRB41]